MDLPYPLESLILIASESTRKSTRWSGRTAPTSTRPLCMTGRNMHKLWLSELNDGRLSKLERLCLNKAAQQLKDSCRAPR
jgi:hypothetical protein